METLTLDRYRGVPLGAEAFVPFLDSSSVELKAGRLLRLGRAGTTVTVRSGEVWITEQGNPRDVVLRSGQAFTLSRPGLALAEALSDARLSFN